MNEQNLSPAAEHAGLGDAPPAGRRLTLGWGLAFLAVLTLLVVVALMLRRTQEGSILVGDAVPDFALTTFEGEQIHLADLRGKVVVLNFWASWCKPCEQEAADLEAAWRRYQPAGDVVFIGVNYVDTEPEAKGYLTKFQITYPNGPDLGTRISQEFRIRGVPETYFIDRDGNLAYAQIGPFSSVQQISALIEPLLQK
ncbi:MAG: hypothetical protein Fur0018_14760 [Anaerolineales bacterium]